MICSLWTGAACQPLTSTFLQFVDKAPADVVGEVRQQLAVLEEKIAAVDQKIATMTAMAA